jgi:hypothetical protein
MLLNWIRLVQPPRHVTLARNVDSDVYRVVGASARREGLEVAEDVHAAVLLHSAPPHVDEIRQVISARGEGQVLARGERQVVAVHVEFVKTKFLNQRRFKG